METLAFDTLTQRLTQAESLVLAHEIEAALSLLRSCAEDIEEYVDRNCPTTDAVQWFCFPTPFELLAYKKVEQDRREIRVIGEPFDRAYADLAYVQMQENDIQGAIDSLKQAVRWNPMECAYRLDLAELFRLVGDEQEYLALTYSTFERASEPLHLVRAYTNFAAYYGRVHQTKLQAACLRSARQFGIDDATLQAALQLAQGTPADPSMLSNERAKELLAAEGLPEGANTELVICLLMCATDAAKIQDRHLATELTVRAYNLVGAKAAEALLSFIREADEELYQERRSQQGTQQNSQERILHQNSQLDSRQDARQDLKQERNHGAQTQ